MREIVTGGFAARGWNIWTPGSVRVVDWNIERGLKLGAILDFLVKQDADLLVLQEVDVNAKRTGRLNVAEEIARELKMDYVFGCEFEELVEGSRASPAYTGQATLCRWPLVSSRIIRFRLQSGFWRPRWFIPNTRPFQERLGGRVALVTEVRAGARSLAVYNLHLESRDHEQLRISQLEEVIADTEKLPSQMPVLIAGDLNFDTTQGRAAGVIQMAGFSDAVGFPSAPTTPRRSLFTAGRIIDRAIIRGPVEARGRIHNSTLASDHYPLSFTLDF